MLPHGISRSRRGPWRAHNEAAVALAQMGGDGDRPIEQHPKYVAADAKLGMLNATFDKRRWPHHSRESLPTSMQSTSAPPRFWATASMLLVGRNIDRVGAKILTVTELLSTARSLHQMCSSRSTYRLLP
jgi:hypothetical protein